MISSNPTQAELRVLAGDYASFRAEMLASAPQESVGLIFAGWWTDGSRLWLVWRDFWPVGDGAYLRRGPAGAQVSPEYLMPAVKRCRLSGEALLLAHTHPFSSLPNFSGIDDGGEDELIPKIAARAPTAPHGGLVLGQAGATVRVWPSGVERPVTAAMRIVGDAAPGGSSATEYARQDLALGPGTAAELSRRHVAVVGTGGLGWEMATLLWSHGVGALTLVDPDAVEEHNRPRLRGSAPGDVGRAKVEALADMLGRMRHGRINTVHSPVEGDGARASICATDLILCGTDTLSSRLAVDRLSRRCLVPLIDAGINIQLSGDRVTRVGGRVSVSWPGGPCLSCMKVLTPDAVAAEADPLGYRGVGRLDAPSVAAFNAVVASLAVAEALDLLVRYRASEPRSRYLVYDGIRGLVREIGVPQPDACGSCAELRGSIFGAPTP